jgi:hypothetical protein
MPNQSAMGSGLGSGAMEGFLATVVAEDVQGEKVQQPTV